MSKMSMVFFLHSFKLRKSWPASRKCRAMNRPRMSTNDEHPRIETNRREMSFDKCHRMRQAKKPPPCCQQTAKPTAFDLLFLDGNRSD